MVCVFGSPPRSFLNRPSATWSDFARLRHMRILKTTCRKRIAELRLAEVPDLQAISREELVLKSIQNEIKKLDSRVRFL